MKWDIAYRAMIGKALHYSPQITVQLFSVYRVSNSTYLVPICEYKAIGNKGGNNFVFKRDLIINYTKYCFKSLSTYLIITGYRNNLTGKATQQEQICNSVDIKIK